ncbi:MAG: hypothetical protein SH850_12770 [Planctomycetaceae bacterium]|nr:hypothetical protein [Planctomycetaceae bacterium]
MNTERNRKAIAEFAIGLMVCGAVQMFLIGPAEGRARKLQAEADAISGPNDASSALNADQLNSMIAAARLAAEKVSSLSQPARDEAELFGRLMDLASTAGVRVDSLQPTGDSGPAARGFANPAAPPSTPLAAATDPSAPPVAPPPADLHVGYAMVVTAPYAKIIEFLQQIPVAIGFSVVHSVKIEGGDSSGPGLIRARIETEHFAFDVSTVRALSAASVPQEK